MAMAMAIARLASSKVVPRAILSPSILSGNKSRFASLQKSSFCKVADEQIQSRADMKLVKVIDSKIEIAESLDLEKPAGIAPPAYFPFEIEDLPESSQIKLTRKFEGEFIEVIVEKDVNEGEEPTIYSDSDDSDEDVYEYPRRRLFSVRINPQNQERWMLFKCWVDDKSLGITSIEFYESSATVDPILKLVSADVDADLEDYWKKKSDYLKIRGFSNFGFNGFGSIMETCVARSMPGPDDWSRLKNVRKIVKLVDLKSWAGTKKAYLNYKLD